MSEETGTKGGGGPTSFVALLRYINLVTRVARTRTSHSRLRPLSACQYFTADRISEQRELIFVKSMYQADVDTNNFGRRFTVRKSRPAPF